MELCCEILSEFISNVSLLIFAPPLKVSSAVTYFTHTMTSQQLTIPRDINQVILSFFERSYDSLLTKFLKEITTCESARLQAKCRKEITLWSANNTRAKLFDFEMSRMNDGERIIQRFSIAAQAYPQTAKIHEFDMTTQIFPQTNKFQYIINTFMQCANEFREDRVNLTKYDIPMRTSLNRTQLHSIGFPRNMLSDQSKLYMFNNTKFSQRPEHLLDTYDEHKGSPLKRGRSQLPLC